MTKPTVVIGSQWGDEGKGKIIDLLAKDYDYIVRFNGGNNAGHTVSHGGKSFGLHLIPSGVLRKKKLLISQGVVLNPKILLEELEALGKAGIKVDLTIDSRTQIVMPYHQLLDAATEAWKGKAAVGSLKLGIGYCYEDKNNHAGVRFEDLIRPEALAGKVRVNLPLAMARVRNVFGQKDTQLSQDEVIKTYTEYGKGLKRHLGDVSKIVGEAIQKGRGVLFEGAHGTFLDSGFGTYPYTTTIPCISGSVFWAVGIPPLPLRIIGTVKAYTTRVGNGPFPTEQPNEIGEAMQQRGGEIGTTSGRKRRCGWLDFVMLRYAQRINGFTEVALTKLDVLDEFGTLKVAVAYRHKKTGRKIFEFPDQINDLPYYEPVYEILPGWKTNLKNIRRFRDLPQKAQSYLKRIEKELEVPIKLISVGPERGQVILR